jgi:hypothetical protein
MLFSYPGRQPAITVWPDCAKRRQIAVPIPPMPPETKAMRVTAGMVSSRHASGRCTTSAWFPMGLIIPF